MLLATYDQIYIYIYTHIYMCVYTYIYIYLHFEKCLESGPQISVHPSPPPPPWDLPEPL